MKPLPAAARNLLLTGTALLLILVLWFLYQHTQVGDMREQDDALRLLRELQDIDNRWDAEALRARLEPTPDTAPAPNRAPDVKRALDGLAAIAASGNSPALRQNLPQLSQALTEKTALVEKFQADNNAARAALKAALDGAAQLETQAVDAKPRSVMLEQALRTVDTVAPAYYWSGADDQASALQLAAGQLLNAPVAPPLHEAAAQLSAALDQLLAKHQAAQAGYAKLAFLPAGPRLDTLTFAFGDELAATLQDKERYRAYLVGYAGALLVLIAWMAMRLQTAYHGLEERVAERTRELSDALTHLRESEAQLIQSEKMSSLGQMVAGVAHEINTPLAYVKNSLGTVSERLPDIRGAIEHGEQLLKLLQAGPAADPQALSNEFAITARHVQAIKQQGALEELAGLVNDGLYGIGQMSEIVGNLKDFSRLDRSKVSSFDLNEGLNSTLTLARHLLKGVTVRREFGEIPAIVCSPSQINQVFLNLVTNAAQALPEGKGEIVITTRAEDNGVAVDIADNGKGIPPDVLPRIFDPFFTTKEAGKGTGLGLSISYKIVSQHGGRIEVISKPGAGTRFTVHLPLQPPAESELAA